MMYIEDLKEEEEEEERMGMGLFDCRRVVVGAGARALFYPTLVYNLVRNKFQADFRWWDHIQEFLLLGAVPFPTDVQPLKDLGVHGVITLNEPYETLVPTSIYKDHGIDHLVLPTRDYLFAPSIHDICQAVNFIHGKTLLKQATYVHCKAGRGRSTTIVICYLVQHRHMSPDVAYAFVRSIRPRVLLASAQRQAVQEYYHLKVKKSSNVRSGSSSNTMMILRPLRLSPYAADVFTFDDGSVVVITKADVDGYEDEGHDGNMSLVCRVRVAALAKFSRLWDSSKMSGVRLVNWNKCSKPSDEVSINIHLY